MNETHLCQWLAAQLSKPFTVRSMQPGAGLRRYFRVSTVSDSWVAMMTQSDEKCAAFAELARLFLSWGVQVPVIHAADCRQGFLLLTDFGHNNYAESLNAENADILYKQAFAALLRIQSYPQTDAYFLPEFDMVYYREKMSWFIEFYLRRILNIHWSGQQQLEWERLFDLLIATASQQPKTCVHYDFHSRNLMPLPNGQAGVLDFQDAVRGPITYDLMSLLRDCYIDWPPARVQTWMQAYQQAALSAGVLNQEDPMLWRRWCDLSGVQRHIKCIGLFARFKVLGYSADYLVYIPRILNYLRLVSMHYPELRVLQNLLEAIPR